jgi:hypothetical protein
MAVALAGYLGPEQVPQNVDEAGGCEERMNLGADQQGIPGACIDSGGPAEQGDQSRFE